MPAPAYSAAFVAHIEQHKGLLYKVARAYSATEEDRKDLAQEILLQLWKSYPRYDVRFSFSTWMYRVALNTAISSLRRETRRAADVQPYDDVIPAPASLPGEQAQRQRVDELYGLIARLDELDRALVLLFLDGRSYEEMSAVLGLTVTNVATKLSRLKARLKAQHDRQTSP